MQTKSVLITGGTGSLGRALIRRFLAAGVPRVCTYARCEVRQSQLIERYPQVHAFLGDVRDRERLERCLGGVETVIHAAALKRVDGGAYHPDEMLKTNVLGMQAVIDASLRAGVSRILFISSDKACQPTNIYGASKLMAEYLATAANSYTVPRGLRVSAVRYGNVLGSRGSVVHIWRQAVQGGRNLVITDPDMTRFWLTLDQACDLVFDALDLMRGGELIVPCLPSMRLLDVAEALAPGHPRIFAGLRPGGEKLAERLLSEEETSRSRLAKVGHGPERIVVPPAHHSWTSEEWSGSDLPLGVTYFNAGFPAGLIYQSDLAPFGWLPTETMREWLTEVPNV
jgi:UDP-N-acetylglucosamine 4,6-dehydratase